MAAKVLTTALGVTAVAAAAYKAFTCKAGKACTDAKGKNARPALDPNAPFDKVIVDAAAAGDAVGLAISPPNIAFIKYFGKRNYPLNLPSNSSYSLNFDTATHRTGTLVVVRAADKEDRLFLNGKACPLSDRHKKMIALVREHSSVRGGITIFSNNNFATAAGLASSASGMAALGLALASALQFQPSYGNHLQNIVRMGSGSACRSLYDGGVQWSMGEQNDGLDSIAHTVHSADVVDNLKLRFIIVEISDAKKEVSSTDGMKLVEASDFFPMRVTIAHSNLATLTKAFDAADFDTVAKTAGKDSQNMHALAMSVGLTYSTSATRAVIAWVAAYNKKAGRTVLGFTQDAGPNLVLLVQEPDLTGVVVALAQSFKAPTMPATTFVNDPTNMVSSKSLATVTTNAGEQKETVKGLTISRPNKGAFGVPLTAIRQQLSELPPSVVATVVSYIVDLDWAPLPISFA